MKVDLSVPCFMDERDYAVLSTAGECLFLDVRQDDRSSCIQLSCESAKQLRDALDQWLKEMDQ